MVDYRIIDYEPAFYESLDIFWKEIGVGGSYRGDNAAIILSTIESGGHLHLMLDSNNQIIGSSWLTNDKRRTYLHHFGISEKYRNQGLAAKLLEHSMAVAVKDGYQIKLEVHRDNEPAIRLYRKYGFSYLGDYMVLIKREI